MEAMTKIQVRVEADPGTVFAPEAFSGSIGKTFPLAGEPDPEATLTAAEVIDGGRAVLLTLEVDDAKVRPLKEFLFDDGSTMTADVSYSLKVEDAPEIAERIAGLLPGAARMEGYFDQCEDAGLTMDDLIAFIRARLDEDEQIAREADNRESDWWWGPAAESPAERHIARYDPARVLREVEAKRKSLGLHRPGAPADMADAGTLVVCVSCGPSGNDPDLYMIDEQASLYPCDTVRLLALPWSDHPDYREEWRIGS
jgi:hypothetical protein